MARETEESENRSTLWENRYELLLEFVSREGHCRVPARHVEDGVSLGRWLRFQRKNRDRLNAERAQALERLPGWSWDGQDAKWERAYKLLEEYVRREGTALVPKKHFENDFSLGAWVMHQRSHYRKGQLASERIERLSRIDGWIWEPMKLFEENGKARGLRRQQLTEASLDELAEAIWKILWGLGPIREDRAVSRCVEKLFEDGVITAQNLVAGGPLAELISDAMAAAVDCDFLDHPRDGHLRAVIKDAEFYEPDDWDMCLKRSLNRTALKRDDVIWRAALWARNNLGLEFVEIPPGSVIRERLSQAFDRALEQGGIEEIQGEMFRRRSRLLRPIAVESRLPLEDSTLKGGHHTKWEDGFKRLIDYVSRAGSALVPKRHKEEDGYALGQWVCEQRKRRDVLDISKKEALEKLPDWNWNVNDALWDKGYEYLLRFVEREGHAGVTWVHSEDGYKLGSWVAAQRARRENMPGERKLRLEQLPGWRWKSR